MSNQNITTTEASIRVFGMIFITIAIIISIFLITSQIGTFIKNKAIDDCGKIGRVENISGNLRTSYPLADVYKQCLKDKHIF